MTKDIIQYAATGVVIAISIYILFKVKAIFNVANEIATHTLKRKIDGIWYWSPTKLTMATAWFVALWSYHYDLLKNGFNETAFFALIGVALGAKVTDAYSKKLNPLVQAPDPSKDETEKKEVTNEP